MKIIKSKLEGCVIIEPKVFNDDRGFFLETYSVQRYLTMTGIDLPFVQDNHSRSTKGVLRGLHFQRKNPQGKLVRVVRGSVFDVAVDIRENSKTFGQWEGIELTEANQKQLWIPPGFAHGFLVLSDIADFEYKCTDYYDPLDNQAIHWQDPDLAIAWPKDINIITAEKDASAPSLKSFKF